MARVGGSTFADRDRELDDSGVVVYVGTRMSRASAPTKIQDARAPTRRSHRPRRAGAPS